MTARRGVILRSVVAVGWRVACRPALWREALRQARAASSAPYREFRAVTAYGDPSREPSAADVLRWLAWARSLRRLGSGGRSVKMRRRG